MTEHYYTQNPNIEHDEQTVIYEVLGNKFTCTTDAGVFSRDGVDTGSRILMEAAGPLSGKVLDMGAGWGAVGITIAKAYPDTFVTMAEINSRAIELIHKNMAANGVSNCETVATDGYTNVTGVYDYILTNPPIRAGKAVIYQMFADAREHLAPNGAMFIVIRKQQGAPSAQKYLATLFSYVRIVEKEAGFWILRCAGHSPVGV